MSKVCPNCQQALGDADKFCPSCGARINEPAAEPEAAAPAAPEAPAASEPTVSPAAPETPVTPVTPTAPVTPMASEPAAVPLNQPMMAGFDAAPAVPQKSGKGTLIAIIAVIVVVVIGVAVALYFLVFGGNKDYEGALDSYMEYMDTFETDALKGAIGEGALNAALESNDASESDFNTGCERMAELYAALGVDMTISDIEYGDAEELDKDDLEDYEEDLDCEVTEGYQVPIYATVEGGDDIGVDSPDGDYLEVILVDGDWCVAEACDAVDTILELASYDDDEFESYLELYSAAAEE